MARERHEPTPEQRARVEELRDEGCSIREIAREIGVHHNTLVRQYARELGRVSEAALAVDAKHSADIAEATLARYRAVITGKERLGKGEAILLIFGLKAKCGWRETAPSLDPDARRPQDVTEDQLDEAVRRVLATDGRSARVGEAAAGEGSQDPDRVH